MFSTGPLPPQNITVGPVTASQVSVHWKLLSAPFVANWTFIVCCEDMSSGQDRIVTNISRISSEAEGFQFYSTVIGGLESYRKYRVDVYTITQHGIASCGQEPVTVQTGKLFHFGSYIQYIDRIRYLVPFLFYFCLFDQPQSAQSKGGMSIFHA